MSVPTAELQEFAVLVADRYRQLMAALGETDHACALNRIAQLERCETALNRVCNTVDVLTLKRIIEREI